MVLGDTPSTSRLLMGSLLLPSYVEGAGVGMRQGRPGVLADPLLSAHHTSHLLTVG